MRRICDALDEIETMEREEGHRSLFKEKDPFFIGHSLSFYFLGAMACKSFYQPGAVEKIIVVPPKTEDYYRIMAKIAIWIFKIYRAKSRH